MDETQYRKTEKECPGYWDRRSAIVDWVVAELNRQLDLWGVQDHHDTTWLAILGEEYGEACKATNDDDQEGIDRELVQVAAVAIAHLENRKRSRQ